MDPVVVMILVFLAVVLIVFTGYSLVRDVSNQDPRRIKRRLAGEADGEGGAASSLFKNLAAVAKQPLDLELDEAPRSWRERFNTVISQSGLTVTPGRVLLKALVVGLALGIVFWLLSGRWWVGVVPFALGASWPILYVFRKRHQRLDKMRSQLADAFGLMGRVLRAGQTPAQAMELVSQELEDPVAGEFALCHEEQKLGMPAEVALRDLAKRTGLLEIKMFVVAGMVHREAGGNLAELLDNLSQVIRERFRIRGVIRTLTAEGRFQAAVLLLLPFVLFILLMMMKPEYFSVLLDYPWLIVGAFMSELIGALWIRRIINFDF